VELFQKAGFVFGFPGAALAAFIPAVPIMIQSSRAAFASVNQDLEETALTMGKSKFTVFRKITFPLAKRTLLIGLGLSSARVLGDFGVTLMVAGNIPGRTQTLPLYIYGQVESLNFAQAHYAALLLICIGIASLWFVKSLEMGAHERIY
jgi:molybdate transport system permease protein